LTSATCSVAIQRVAEDDDAELAAIGAFEIAFDAALEEAVVAAAPGDEIGDGADLEAVQLGERHQLRQARHRAVVVHDLADDGGGVEPGKAGDVDAGFGVAGAD